MKNARKAAGFSRYIIFESGGQIFDTKRQIFLPYKKQYKLCNDLNQYVSISIRKLYYNTFHNVFCIDTELDKNGQIWKYIYDSKEYLISNYGRVKSLKRNKAIIMKQQLNGKNGKGYYKVKLSINGKLQSYFVHKLVADHFVDNNLDALPNEIQVHHISDRLNNKADNLQFVTKEQHAKIHGKELHV